MSRHVYRREVSITDAIRLLELAESRLAQLRRADPGHSLGTTRAEAERWNKRAAVAELVLDEFVESMISD